MPDRPTLVPQPHGGAIIRGHIGNGRAANGKSWRLISKETRAVMEGFFEENVLLLQARCRDEDSRVSIMALGMYFDRFIGKAGDTGFAQDGAGGVRTLDHLTEEQAAEVAAALAVLQKHAGGAAGDE